MRISDWSSDVCSSDLLPGAVIRKRLEANGADLSRVFIQSRRFQLTQEMVDWLEAQIAKHQPRLVFLDPIQAFMSGVDARNHIEVREIGRASCRVNVWHDV